MKTNNYLYRWLLISLVLMSCLIAVPQTAKADAFDDLVSIFCAAEVPGFPSCDDIKAAEDFFRKIDQGEDPLQALDEFKNATGQAVFGNSIPSWFWSIIDGYIAIKEGDFWGVVGAFGETVICAAAQVLAASIDVCAIIKALIEVGEALYDAAKAILAFFGDILDAVWDALEGACCAVLGWLWGGCDDDTPAPPPEALAFVKYFTPYLQNGDGLGWIEHEYGGYTFQNKTDSLESAAKREYGDGAAQAARRTFASAVDQQWTADLLNRVLPALAKEREDFQSEELSHIPQWAKDCVAQCTSFKHDNSYPCDITRNHILQTCTTQIHAQSPGNFDWWLKNHDPVKMGLCDAGAKWCAKGVTNSVWCDNFASNFMPQLDNEIVRQVQTICPSDNSGPHCNSLDDYNKCNAIMASVGSKQKCSVDPGIAGLDLAHKIQAYFNEHGSQISCHWPTIINNSKPVDFTCERSTQVALCKQFVGNSSPFLNCKLQETSQYSALKARVVVVVHALRNNNMCEAVSSQKRLACLQSLKTSGGVMQASKTGIAGNETEDQGKLKVGSAVKGGMTTVINPNAPVPCSKDVTFDIYDPLIATANHCIAEKTKSYSEQDFGFGPPSTKPGFNYDRSQVNIIDGASTPVLLSGPSKTIGGGTGKQTTVAPEKQPLTTVELGSKIQEAVQNGTVKELLEQSALNLKSNPDNPADTGVGTGNQGGTGNVSLKKGITVPSMGGTGDTGGGDHAGPVMSGNVTITEGADIQGQTQTQSTNAAEAANAGTPMSVTIAPDLTSKEGPKIAGQSAAWGGTLTVEGKEAVSRNNGVCEFQFEYAVRNTGNGPLNAGGASANKTFRALLTNSAAGGSWTHVFALMAPKSAKSDTVRIPLKPGKNVLQLVLDDQQQIQESNENNNSFKVTVIVKGKCEKNK